MSARRSRAVRAGVSGLMLVLAACLPGYAQDAAAPKGWEKLPPVDQLGRGNDCTWARTIDSWEAVDRDHIIVKGAGRERYLVRFSGACIANPRFEVEIGVISRDSRLCPYGGDALVIDGERCMILNIWKLPEEGE